MQKRLPILAVVMMSLFGSGVAIAVKNETRPLIGQVVPDRAYRDADGRTTKLSALRGHGVIVLFWATWCPYCARLMPELEHQ